MTFDEAKEMVIDYSDTLDENESYYIFGAPEQVVLNNRQHYNNCGIESTLNNLAMAGIVTMTDDLKDQEDVENSFLKNAWTRNLAGDDGEIGVLDEADGGTRPDDYRDLMEYYGVDSRSYYITTKSDEYVYPKENINELAYKISQGYGAILGVCSDVLWNEIQSETGEKQVDHVIAITGVVYDTEDIDPVYNPLTDTYDYVAPVGFYIHDTGAWMTRFISYDDFIAATLCDYVGVEDDPDYEYLSSLKEYDSKLGEYIAKEVPGIFVTVTESPIKMDTFRLNATGDSYANQLWGNSSDNLIKGMAGNDTLYGGAGRDEIYGGSGNDIIIGNDALNINATVAGEQFEFNTVDDFKGYLAKANVTQSEQDRLDGIVSDNYEPELPFANRESFIDYLQDNLLYGINTLYGEAGNDIIIGGEQADLIYGDKGNDYIYGGDGRNAIYGGAGNDVIIGGYDNDRLFGDAGNDYIFGLDDDDVIEAGAGNDHIYGGGGYDTIEVGLGNDTVYFEGSNFGQDEIKAKGGVTVFKFIDDDDVPESAVSASDMFYSLEADEENEKIKSLTIKDTLGDIDDDESAISFEAFYNTRNGATKALYIDAREADDGIYRVSTSRSARATVANTRTVGVTVINSERVDNADINNLLLTTYNRGTTITTSTKNDIVTMCSSDGLSPATAVDKITYTGGEDKYVSEERNTHYHMNDAISDETSLAIYDNVIGIEVDENTTLVSHDDRLYLKDNDVNYLFDIGLNDMGQAITTENTGLYLLNKNVGANAFASVANGDAAAGFIYMDSFFKFDEDDETLIAGDDFYGNGQIEGIYYNGSEDAYDYTARFTDVIAAQVAGWLSNDIYNPDGYDHAFEAFEHFDELTIAAQSALVGAYTVQPV